jgi:hypothetical protein
MSKKTTHPGCFFLDKIIQRSTLEHKQTKEAIMKYAKQHRAQIGCSSLFAGAVIILILVFLSLIALFPTKGEPQYIDPLRENRGYAIEDK